MDPFQARLCLCADSGCGSVARLNDKQLEPDWSPHHNPLKWTVCHVAFSYELFVLSVVGDKSFVDDSQLPPCLSGATDSAQRDLDLAVCRLQH